MPDLSQSTQSLKSEALRLGFEVSGCAPASSPGTFPQFQTWLQQQFHGEMEYMETRQEAYSHPNFVMEQSVSVMMLAMQVGVSARAAICAVDMAAAGAQAPVDVLLGKFGYFTLMETADNIDRSLAAMGSSGSNKWKITETAHKPFPAGRATQSVLTMFMEIFSKNNIDIQDIEEIKVEVPPLIMLLVGRPLTD